METVSDDFVDDVDDSLDDAIFCHGPLCLHDCHSHFQDMLFLSNEDNTWCWVIWGLGEEQDLDQEYDRRRGNNEVMGLMGTHNLKGSNDVNCSLQQFKGHFTG